MVKTAHFLSRRSNIFYRSMIVVPSGSNNISDDILNFATPGYNVLHGRVAVPVGGDLADLAPRSSFLWSCV